jgi:hypothetical protein
VALEEKTRVATGAGVVRREVVGKIKKEVMYVCPHCDCVLGFAFFFGGLLTGRPKTLN